MADKDLFAPITKDELAAIKPSSNSSKDDLFAPITKLEKAQLDRPSELDSSMRGAAQGISLGFADENRRRS